MRIQVWTSNYAPEPQGIGPLSAVMAENLRHLGHDVLVVAAHPHYPAPSWGARARPYREERNGVSVLRLPLWVGRANGRERIRQEFSFAAAQASVAGFLPPCDVVLAVCPSFPAVIPAMSFSALRRTPWVLWLQDIVTDGAASTGLLKPGRLLEAARRIERWSYASASRIVVISDSFRLNLMDKGVSPGKIARIYNSSTAITHLPDTCGPSAETPPHIVVMGNIGHSQGLDRIVDAFQASEPLRRRAARLVICGHGVQAESVRERIRDSRVEMTGVLDFEALDAQLKRAAIGVVSQRADVSEFNLPSKLMNYLAYGLPVVASVRPESETATIVRTAGAGVVTDAARPEAFADAVETLLADRSRLEAIGAAGRSFADAKFHPRAAAIDMETVLLDAVHGRHSRVAGRPDAVRRVTVTSDDWSAAATTP